MPGAGKSTIGVLLAKELTYSFVDINLIIQNIEKSSLNEKGGYTLFRTYIIYKFIPFLLQISFK